MACKKETAARRKFKVCNRCGAENLLNISQCRSCGSSKFAPSWVRAKRPVNRQVSVEITAPNPQYGESAERVTLSKWWPGGRANFHLPNAGQWGKIESIINDDLGPALGWKTEKELVEAIHAGGKAKKPGEAKDNYRKLIEAHPDILKKLVGAIDPARLSGQEFERVVETLGEVSEALTSANAGFREAFTTVVRKLPRQKQRALEDLGLLLEGWSLQVVTNVAQQVKARIDTIELFDE
jgi:ribosomal protein L40E